MLSVPVLTVVVNVMWVSWASVMTIFPAGSYCASMYTSIHVGFRRCRGLGYREPASLDWMQFVLLYSLCHAGVFMVAVVVVFVMVMPVTVMLVMRGSLRWGSVMYTEDSFFMQCVLGSVEDGGWRGEGLCAGVCDERNDRGKCEAHYLS
jgi:hypothetical protein